VAHERVQSLGLLGLGGVVLAFHDASGGQNGERVLYATNYRAEQRIAKLCFVGLTSTGSERAWRLHAVEVPITSDEAGGDLFRVVLTDHGEERRGYQVFNANDDPICSGTFSTQITEDEKSSLSLAPVPQRTWQELFIRSEVELRWFRSVLRRRAVRVGLKELDHELRFYAREVEEALQSEDEAQLYEALERLRGAELRIQETTGIAPFPSRHPLVLLPES